MIKNICRSEARQKLKEEEKMEKISVQVEKSLLEASDSIKKGDYVNAAAVIAEFEEVEKTYLKYRSLVEAMKVKLAAERRLNATKDPEATIQDKIAAELGLSLTTHPATEAPKNNQPSPVSQKKPEQNRNQPSPIPQKEPEQKKQPEPPTTPTEKTKTPEPAKGKGLKSLLKRVGKKVIG